MLAALSPLCSRRTHRVRCGQPYACRVLLIRARSCNISGSAQSGMVEMQTTYAHFHSHCSEGLIRGYALIYPSSSGLAEIGSVVTAE